MKRMNYKKFFRFFYSLRAQLITYYMVISLVVLAVGAYFSYSYILDILKKNTEKSLLQQFSQADYNIQNVLNNVDRLSRMFLLDDTIQQFLQDNYDTSEFTIVETQNHVLDRIAEFVSNNEFINSIYIFTENRGGIGGSDKYTSIIPQYSQNRFFTSGMYQAAKKAFPKASLEGGITEDYFREYDMTDGAHVLSFARGVRPIFEPNRSATLLFNIDERYIASIYAKSGSFIDGSMFIVDPKGKIVSGNEPESIADVYSMFSSIDAKSDYGSFISSNSGNSIQVVYYKLKSTDFYLVGEIPLQYFYKDTIILRRVLVIVFIVSFLAIGLASFLWIRKITQPLNIIAAKMSDVGKGNLGLTFSKIPRNEFGIVIKRFNEMSVSIADLIRKNDETQEGKRELEIEALQFQINPHFLYNTLNMIKWMAAGIKAKNIVDCIIALGNMLKPLFKNTEPMCSIREELEYLENYIKIISWRFSSKVNFRFDISEEFYNYKLPRFILQPIIENSMSHGMQMQDSQFEISILVMVDGNELHLIISDTGKGIDSSKLEEINASLENPENAVRESSKGSIGLYNINRRIKLNFGEQYGIRAGNTGSGGAKVTVRIPVVHQENLLRS